jgi:phospholipid/cholesterol/gamma-HCH transport system permease protein
MTVSLQNGTAIAPRIELFPGEPRGLTIKLIGDWILGQRVPPWTEIQPLLDEALQQSRHLHFDSTALHQWDSQLLSYLLKILELSESRGVPVEREGLPYGVRGMLKLALAIPERQDTGRTNPESYGFLHTIGDHTLSGFKDFLHLAEFLGELTVAFGRFIRGQARFRSEDLWSLITECGPRALPIISLISLLVGMILAFVGAVQLKLFGAQIFIADLVGLGMAREMGAMMTAILMSGRTGAAFAAELGSMTVNDEIDALKTSGFSPMEFLVLPRVLALFLMIPLLCLYADIVGMIGGAIVAQGLFDISYPEYLIQIQNRLRPIDFEVGIVKSAVFGILVAIAGCMRGLQCSRSATAVGVATTSAVVTGIVFIVMSDAVMTLLVTALNLYKR